MHAVFAGASPRGGAAAFLVNKTTFATCVLMQQMSYAWYEYTNIMFVLYRAHVFPYLAIFHSLSEQCAPLGWSWYMLLPMLALARPFQEMCFDL